jgi:SM-20-related protein
MELIPISDRIGVMEEIWTLPFEKNPLPSGYTSLPFQIFKKVASEEELRLLTSQFEGEKEEGRVVGGGLNRKERRVNLYPPSPTAIQTFLQIVGRVSSEIERFWGGAIGGGSEIQLLEYLPGGFYNCHADNASTLKRGDRVIGFRVVKPERRLTTLLFLNDRFEGGELEFCFLKWLKSGEPVRLTPEAGELVVFPSHGLYSHRVHPVRSGRRLAMVKWWNLF